MNTFERVRGIIASNMDTKEEQITLETSLTDDLAADSLSVVEITMALEEAFCVDFGEEALGLTTVEQIVNYIQAKLREQS